MKRREDGAVIDDGSRVDDGLRHVIQPLIHALAMMPFALLKHTDQKLPAESADSASRNARDSRDIRNASDTHDSRTASSQRASPSQSFYLV